MRASRVFALAAGLVLASSFAVPGWGASTGTVTSGTFGTFAWKLSATDSADGYVCLTMTLLQHPGDRSSECGSIFGPQAGRAHGITYLAHTGRPAPDYIVGPVIASAKSVLVALSNRKTIRTRTVGPPNGMTAKIAFYVAKLPCPARLLSVRGLDSGGRTVAHLSIPQLKVRGKPAC
jgi:hypothetical protein